MRAAVRTGYGGPDVLHLAELPTPEPGPGEVRVRVRATSVTYGDLTARDFPGVGPDRFNMPAPLFYAARLQFGWSRPRNPVLGSEYAGEVDAVGTGVTAFAPGDRVLGYRGPRMGAYAEYLVEKADGMIARLADGIAFEDAAVLPYGGTTALALLDAVDLRAGEHVLIVGASGSIGMAAVQIASDRGAHVVGVAGPRNQAWVRALGAEEVLDHTRDDPSAGGPRYELVFDVRGRLGFARARRVLTPHGRYLPVSFKLPLLVDALRTRRAQGPRVRIVLAPERPDDMRTVARMIAEGSLRAHRDRTWELAEAAEAHRYAESGAKSGQVALRV
ncbi:MAG: NAD(P)-dependent alcohol dehydrogenase [Gemmatimonadota bacterium]